MSNETEKKKLPRKTVVTKIRFVRAKHGGPIRTIVERRDSKPTGKFASAKRGLSLPWESLHERHLMWISEADARVRRFLAQPFRLEFTLRGVKRKMIYFPDLERVLDDGTIEVIEVKKSMDEVVKDRDYAFKIALAKKACRARGYRFRIVTAQDYIDSGPRLKNAIAIKCDRFAKLRTIDIARFLEAIEQAGGKLSYAQAIAAVSEKGDPEDGFARRKLHAMIVRRLGSIDIDKPITPGSPVTQVKTVRPFSKAA
jgi:hypothetical protein